MTVGVNDALESRVSRILSAYSYDSLRMGLQSLREHNESLAANDNQLPIRRNGFVQSEEFELFRRPIIGGNGLLTIHMSYYPIKEDKHDISILDHATNEVTHLGYFTAYGFQNINQGCCPHEPRLLSCLTQDGNYVVLFGPQAYTRSQFPRNSQTPVIAIYQLEPPMQLLEKRFKDTPFIKCDPAGIALSPASISSGQYLVAIVTYSMAILLLNVVTLERSTLQLDSVVPQLYIEVELAPKVNCVAFSPDGRFLSVMCFMENQAMTVCLIIDVTKLEPLYWMEADGKLFCLGWLFPMFSACGTKVVISTYSDCENMYDESKYELKFYKISCIQSLKILCRVVILECTEPSSVDQLPLPKDLIAFLGGGSKIRGYAHSSQQMVQMNTEPSEQSENETTCRCTLL